MIDIKLIRENPDLVRENIRKKFQDSKLPLVDEVIALDIENRNTKKEAEALRAEKNKVSKSIGALMAKGKKEEAEAMKKKVSEQADRLKELEEKEVELGEKVKKIMMTIPNIIDPSVPMTVKMWKFKDMVNQLFLILRFLITQKLWKLLMVLIWTVLEK